MGHNYRQLCEAERIEIFRLLEAGMAYCDIARHLRRSRSTISREIQRNSAGGKQYLPVAAERLACRRRHARRGSKIGRSSRLWRYVGESLAMGHSPEQISGRLKRCNSTLSISHESIYRFIYSREGRRDKLHTYLAQRKSRRGVRARLWQRKPLIPDRIDIDQRPGAIKAQLLFGHWEADLMIFAKRLNPILVLVEQKTRFILAARQDNKTSHHTASMIRQLINDLPKPARLSMTFDNGGEFAAHKTLGLDTYFCRSHSPWQKGAVENAIGRLRRRLPRATLIGELEQAQIDAIIDLQNNTPRKCIGFRTPAEVMRVRLKAIRKAVALDV